jgi:hypothetical protein
MSRINRRNLITSISGVSALSLAGCSDITSTEEPNREPREPPEENAKKEEGEVGSIKYEPSSSGAEYSFNIKFDGTIYEKATFVVKGVLYEDIVTQSDETSSATPTTDIVFEKEISGSNEETKNPMSFAGDISEWNLEKFLNKGAIVFQFGVKYESKSGIDIINSDLDIAWLYYTYGKDEKTKVTQFSQRHVWQQNGKYHYKLIARLWHSKHPDYEDHPSNLIYQISFTVEESVVEALQEYNESRPEALLCKADGDGICVGYTETHRTDIGEVQYLERPIFGKIADGLQDVLEKFSLTGQDRTIVDSALGLLSGTIRYKQDWDYISEAAIVPFPEELFLDGYGDCKGQGFAINGILHHLGFDTSIFLLRQPKDPPLAFYHLTGGVGMELDQDLYNRLEHKNKKRLLKNSASRYPEVAEAEEASKHISIDPTLANLANYNKNALGTVFYYKEGKDRDI